ncbi:HAD family hydrolase [Lichenihabitans sp. Uapishka_5]|uniref:HAD family hydrolase n=1 Tax=Lichenihabitans sp. Uapishka_5 TaxID=3037302 RepID=UPI0029E7DEDB|nr:HAD family hydrolase [Lichenihabitans sp. Uapishka_5]MDX7951879.1 HAD family hydrolase [Lichenihabitans sp. Uapishka_5]
MSDAKTPQSIKVLLADVDGTLVTEQKVLTERTVAAIKALRQNGVTFAVTSGRPPKGMDMLIAPLGLDTPIAGFNGGAMVKPDGSVIEEKTLPPDVARAAIALILKHKMDAWLYTAKDWFVHDRKAPHCDREAWTVKFEPVVVTEFSEPDLDKAVKIVGVSDDRELVAQCEADAQQAFGSTVSAARSQPYYLDITHPQANKGDVVETLSKLLGVPKDQFATIGDMPNDVNMFKKSGFSIAMGNASDAVKAQASATTESYNDEGFAKAVERFILKTQA